LTGSSGGLLCWPSDRRVTSSSLSPCRWCCHQRRFNFCWWQD